MEPRLWGRGGGSEVMGVGVWYCKRNGTFETARLIDTRVGSAGRGSEERQREGEGEGWGEIDRVCTGRGERRKAAFNAGRSGSV